MFCHYCGKQISDNMSFCPHCGKTVKTKNAVNPLKKRHFRKLFICLLSFVIILCGAVFLLIHTGVIDIPFSSISTANENLKTLNQKCIIIKEIDRTMETEYEGTATILIQLPNYELLFSEASKSKNPDQYLLDALASGNYEISSFEDSARITVENKKTIIHSEEAVQKHLEYSLIDAINALAEVQ